MSDSSAARKHMIECQLMPNGVTDSELLAALEAVPRELFVPKSLRGVAYVDEDLQIAPGRYLTEPRVFARLLAAAEIDGGEVVLDVGCGRGYSTAVIARLASSVVALESDEALAAAASETLTELEVDNAAVVTGPLAEGYPSQAPYDVILLSGAVDEIPPALTEQLNDGGRLLAVVGVGAAGGAVLVVRHDDVLARRSLFDAAVPPLPGFQVEPGFVF
jgi:protein-L-isoaspartate(D-aspartate) O-methyltransferase